jgi:hypothetical protein
MNARVQKPMEWPADGQSLYNNEPVQHMDVSSEFFFLRVFNERRLQDQSVRARKHSRTWEHGPQLHGRLL